MPAKNTNTNENIFATTSYLWDSNPKLLQLLDAIDFSSITTIDPTKVFQKTSEPKGEDYFTNLFSGLSPLQLEKLFHKSNHWLNKAEVQFIIDSWQERTTKIKKLQQQLDDLTEANHKIFNGVIQDINLSIKKMDYKKALSKTEVAAVLKVDDKIILKLFMEIAFWYNESGDQKQAIAVLEAAANSLAITDLANVSAQNLSRQEIQKILSNLDKVQYDFLMRRYYPFIIKIKGNKFMLGCDGKLIKKVLGAEAICTDRENQRLLTIGNYGIAETPVTWWQIGLYRKANKIYFKIIVPEWQPTGDHPVVNISWYQTVDYANWVSTQLGYQKVYTIDKKKQDASNGNPHDKLKWTVIWDKTKSGFHLPTEAQWEYAAKTDDLTFFSGTNSKAKIHKYCNYRGVRPSHTSRVKSLLPNKWKIYDMSGNVFEWCWDWYVETLPGELPKNYAGPIKGMHKSLRGGSWGQGVSISRCSTRNYRRADINNVSYEGVRLAFAV